MTQQIYYLLINQIIKKKYFKSYLSFEVDKFKCIQIIDIKILKFKKKLSKCVFLEKLRKRVLVG